MRNCGRSSVRTDPFLSSSRASGPTEDQKYFLHRSLSGRKSVIFPWPLFGGKREGKREGEDLRKTFKQQRLRLCPSRRQGRDPLLADLARNLQPRPEGRAPGPLAGRGRGTDCHRAGDSRATTGGHSLQAESLESPLNKRHAVLLTSQKIARILGRSQSAERRRSNIPGANPSSEFDPPNEAWGLRPEEPPLLPTAILSLCLRRLSTTAIRRMPAPKLSELACPPAVPT